MRDSHPLRIDSYRLWPQPPDNFNVLSINPAFQGSPRNYSGFYTYLVFTISRADFHCVLVKRINNPPYTLPGQSALDVLPLLSLTRSLKPFSIVDVRYF